MSVWIPVIIALPALITAVTAYLKAHTATNRAAQVAQTVADHVNTDHGK